MIDGALLLILGILGLLAAIAFARGGSPLLLEGLGRGASLLLQFALLLVVSFLAAGLAEVLLPREWIAGALGADSGLRGILLAAAAGSLTPAGPFTAMPIAAVLMRSGAAPGPLVAYVTGWSLLALHRLIAWEVPILGARFAAFRFAISLVLPVLAGLLARLATRGSA